MVRWQISMLISSLLQPELPRRQAYFGMKVDYHNHYDQDIDFALPHGNFSNKIIEPNDLRYI